LTFNWEAERDAKCDEWKLQKMWRIRWLQILVRNWRKDCLWLVWFLAEKVQQNDAVLKTTMKVSYTWEEQTHKRFLGLSGYV
jgi:hypothetical protein